MSFSVNPSIGSRFSTGEPAKPHGSVRVSFQSTASQSQPLQTIPSAPTIKPFDTLCEAICHLRKYYRDRGHFIHLDHIELGEAINVIVLQSGNISPDNDPVIKNRIRELSHIDCSAGAVRSKDSAAGKSRAQQGLVLTRMNMYAKPIEQARCRDFIVSLGGHLMNVSARPWDYAFSMKIHKILTTPSHVDNAADLRDTVSYLNRIILARTFDGEIHPPLNITEVMGWAEQYHLDTKRDYLLGTFNSQFSMFFGRVGIQA